jgi:hypothetical protein
VPSPDDVETSVHYPEDDRYLIGRNPRVSHYEVAGSKRSG